MHPTPEIILGPPGTGKTTTLIGIVRQELARGVEPEEIGYVSFTRKAATEARDRAIEALPQYDKSRFTWFRTMHSLAFRCLGLSSGEVLEGEKLNEFGDWIGIKVSGRFRMDEGNTFGFEKGDRILFMENLARVRGVSLREQYDLESDDQSWWEVERVGRALAEWKKTRHLVDYTDMLQIFRDQDYAPRLRVLLVDEAQDLSMLQWQCVFKLAEHCERLVIAGDDDQAIYNWAGAAVDYFVDMPGDVRVLDQSWRVPRLVQMWSDRVLRTVRHRREKVWQPRAENGEVKEMPLDEIDWSGKDMLVLARNVMHLREVERRIRSAGYMYDYRGKASIKDDLRRAIFCWDRLTRQGQPQTADDMVKVYQHMSSGQGVARGHKTLPEFKRDDMVTVDDLKARGGLLRTDVWHDAFDRVPASEREYIRSCLRRGERISQRARIRLSTIHGAKGGEAEHVIVIPDMAPRTYQEMQKKPDDEARVWYVAATRAKQRLTICKPKTNAHFTFPMF